MGLTTSIKILVKVKPSAKEEKFEEADCSSVISNPFFSGRCFIASVNRPAKEGKANEMLIKLAANYFKTSLSRVEIISGAKAKNKILGIK